MAINIQEIAELLHLDEITADIYFEILTHTELSLEKITVFTGQTKQDVQKSIKILLDKGFITSIETTKKHISFKALSLAHIEERIDRDREIFKNLKQIILPHIQNEQKLGIIKYEGWAGIRHVYIEILNEAIKTKEPILAFEKIPNKDQSAIGKIFLENYLKKRIQNKIIAKVITCDDQASREYKEQNDSSLTDTLILSKIKLQGTINIVGDLVMSFSTKPPQGTLRRNKIEANDLKNIFNMLWDSNTTPVC